MPKWCQVYNPDSSRRIAVAALLLAATILTARALARSSDVRRLLQGKWHQEYGVYVTETVLLRNGEFTSITIQRGAPYKLYVEGEWELRNNDSELWMHYLRWEPRDVRMPEWEGSWIEFVDDDHFRNKLGDVYRVR